ncbi:uncharacterized protein LOC121396156 [Xenopus laevis]|uniref:Uncharacterized protein LOC121396156 n=1 Tax=Xenopus laevis TaxID=8355 RepID=A0A8J1LDC9_XENLA|nr:uncharacterized protein LOC121396156 [Xenopus laevis]
MKVLDVRTVTWALVMVLFSLRGIRSLTGPASPVTAHSGESLTVSCTYNSGFETHRKYWCRGGNWKNCNVVIKTSGRDGETTSGRFSIRDVQSQRTFSVTITAVTREDEDTYFCGVERFLVDDMYVIKVTVLPGKVHMGLEHRDVTLTAHCDSKCSKTEAVTFCLEKILLNPLIFKLYQQLYLRPSVLILYGTSPFSTLTLWYLTLLYSYSMVPHPSLLLLYGTSPFSTLTLWYLTLLYSYSMVLHPSLLLLYGTSPFSTLTLWYLTLLYSYSMVPHPSLLLLYGTSPFSTLTLWYLTLLYSYSMVPHPSLLLLYGTSPFSTLTLWYLTLLYSYSMVPHPSLLLLYGTSPFSTLTLWYLTLLYSYSMVPHPSLPCKESSSNALLLLTLSMASDSAGVLVVFHLLAIANLEAVTT